MEDIMKLILQGNDKLRPDHPLYSVLHNLDQHLEQAHQQEKDELPSKEEAQPTVNKPTPVDMYKVGDRLLIFMEAAGVNKNDIDINLGADNTLMVGLEKRCPVTRDACVCLQKERRYGYINRLIKLPNDIDTSTITAKCDNGILYITCMVKKNVDDIRKIVVE